MADDNPAGIDASPGADATMPSLTVRGPVACFGELAERASALEGPEEDHKLARLTKTVKKLLDDGYDPIVFCRYIPTGRVRRRAPGRQARPQDGNHRGHRDAVPGAADRADRAAGRRRRRTTAPGASWSPPTACPRA